MKEISPRLELLLSATLYCGAPSLHGERLRKAAIAYRAMEAEAGWPRDTPYTSRLAAGALKAADAALADRRIVVDALSDVLRLAHREGKPSGEEVAAEQLVEAGMRQWQSRADLV